MSLNETTSSERVHIGFFGMRNAGKSSLVNALAGEEVMDVNGIREDDSKGRHTTTHRQMLVMKNGAMIIDTPGMRELGMWDVSEKISTSFYGCFKVFNSRFS